MTVFVDKPGLFTTVQDLGRPDARHLGLPAGGAVDAIALRTANLLVGNDENAAVLECALVGPTLRVSEPAIVAVAGARVGGVPYCEPFRIPAGERLDLSRLDSGAYAYVAVAGGIDVPPVLGSRATDVRLALGGWNGRTLRAGDELPVGPAALGALPSLRVRPIGVSDAPIRVVDGKDAAAIDPAWLERMYAVSSKSDRVGVRLAGPRIACTTDPDAASAVVLPGTIQLPADGVPIVLLADAQTLGGYPQVAHVIQADLPRIAQIRPGRPVRFGRVSLADAHRLAWRQEREMAFLRFGVRVRMGRDAND